MKRLISVLLLTLPATLMAELITEREFEHVVANADPAGIVEVDNVSGEIVVHGTNKKEVRVKADLGKNVKGVEFERRGETISIQVRHDRRKDDHGSTDLEIWLPQNSEIDITGVSADIRTDSVKGEQRLKSVSGEIRTELFDANVMAGTVSGDVIAEGKGRTEEVRLESVSGDVRASNLNGDIDVTSVSGDVEVSESRISRGRFSSTSGDVEVVAAISGGDSRVDFETVSGDLLFMVVGATDGSYDFSSFSGDIDNCFGPKVEKSRTRQRLRFGLGNEKARIRGSTMSGDVEICNAK